MGAKKKDFTATVLDFGNNGSVADAISVATNNVGRQGAASKEEQAERAAKNQTQGRKGCRAPHRNISFTTENIEYATAMARSCGMSLAGFLNALLDDHRAQHPELWEQIKETQAAIFATRPGSND